MERFSIEEFVSREHLLRKIESAVEFSDIYDIVKELYCANNRRPSIDPVVIFKMVLIQHLYGIPSPRRTVEEIFYWILREIEKAGYLSPKAVFVDGMHIKANANRKKAGKKAIRQAAKTYTKNS